MLRISHCLDNRLKDGDKVVSSKHRPRPTPKKHYFCASGTHFCWRLSKPQGLVPPERLSKLKKVQSPHWVWYGMVWYGMVWYGKVHSNNLYTISKHFLCHFYILLIYCKYISGCILSETSLPCLSILEIITLWSEQELFSRCMIRLPF
jgi:hypothetical protein